MPDSGRPLRSGGDLPNGKLSGVLRLPGAAGDSKEFRVSVEVEVVGDDDKYYDALQEDLAVVAEQDESETRMDVDDSSTMAEMDEDKADADKAEEEEEEEEEDNDDEEEEMDPAMKEQRKREVKELMKRTKAATIFNEEPISPVKAAELLEKIPIEAIVANPNWVRDECDNLLALQDRVHAKSMRLGQFEQLTHHILMKQFRGEKLDKKEKAILASMYATNSITTNKLEDNLYMITCKFIEHCLNKGRIWFSPPGGWGGQCNGQQRVNLQYLLSQNIDLGDHLGTKPKTESLCMNVAFTVAVAAQSLLFRKLIVENPILLERLASLLNVTTALLLAGYYVPGRTKTLIPSNAKARRLTDRLITYRELSHNVDLMLQRYTWRMEEEEGRKFYRLTNDDALAHFRYETKFDGKKEKEWIKSSENPSNKKKERQSAVSKRAALRLEDGDKKVTYTSGLVHHHPTGLVFENPPVAASKTPYDWDDLLPAKKKKRSASSRTTGTVVEAVTRVVRVKDESKTWEQIALHYDFVKCQVKNGLYFKFQVSDAIIEPIARYADSNGTKTHPALFQKFLRNQLVDENGLMMADHYSSLRARMKRPMLANTLLLREGAGVEKKFYRKYRNYHNPNVAQVPGNEGGNYLVLSAKRHTNADKFFKDHAAHSRLSGLFVEETSGVKMSNAHDHDGVYFTGYGRILKYEDARRLEIENLPGEIDWNQMQQTNAPTTYYVFAFTDQEFWRPLEENPSAETKTVKVPEHNLEKLPTLLFEVPEALPFEDEMSLSKTNMMKKGDAHLHAIFERVTTNLQEKGISLSNDPEKNEFGFTLEDLVMLSP